MKRSIRAFTLLEVIIMVGILALLAGLVINNLGPMWTNSQKDIAKIFVNESVKTSIECYRMDIGNYPSTAEGLAALVTAPANAADRWRGPYMDTKGGKLQLDPWGEPYQYRYPGTKNKASYDLYSKGPDKADGTDDDIGNW